MTYFRLLSGRKAKEDRTRAAAVEAVSATPSEAFRAEWSGPPEAARTFADHSIAEARRACERRPHVVIRDDPMFGRRGYAREVIADEKHGYLILVIAFASRRDAAGEWREPHRPKAEDRRYWPPERVEFA